MSFDHVQTALLTQLNTLSGSYTIVGENDPFNPDDDVAADTVFLEATFMPSETILAEVGTNGKNRLNGLFEISIWCPVGIRRGDYTSRQAAETILAAFKRGDTLEHSTTLVRIMKSWKVPGIPTEKWFIVPINIRWKADVDN